MRGLDQRQSRPVMLIHDLWLHATSLDPWVHLLGEHGRSTTAPGWPGERDSVAGTRAHIGSCAGPTIGLADLICHYQAQARRFHVRPVVVGHGFGALVAEVLLARGEAWAAAAIEPAVLRGPLPMSWPQLVVGTLVLGSGGVARSRWVTLTRHQFQLTFGTALSPRSVADLHRRWSIPSPVGPLIDAATGVGALADELSGVQVPWQSQHHLVLTGDVDRLAPRDLVRTNLASVGGGGGTVVRRIRGRGHSLVIDDGWLDVAYAVLTWLNAIDPLRGTPAEMTRAEH